MQISCHLDEDGSVSLQVSSQGYQPDVFDDLITRVKSSAKDLWDHVHGNAEVENGVENGDEDEAEADEAEDEDTTTTPE